MTNAEYRQYLQSVRQSARDAEKARDRLRLAEDRETGLPPTMADGIRVSTGGVRRDAIAKRVYRAMRERAIAGAKLHDSLEELRCFRSELEASPLQRRACRALWCRHVCGMSYAAIGNEIGLSHATVWRLVRDAETVLAEHLGVQEPPRR